MPVGSAALNWHRYGRKTRHPDRRYVEITTYRPFGDAMEGGGEIVGKALIPAVVTEGIHPKVLEVLNTMDKVWHGRAATATRGER